MCADDNNFFNVLTTVVINKSSHLLNDKDWRTKYLYKINYIFIEHSREELSNWASHFTFSNIFQIKFDI